MNSLIAYQIAGLLGVTLFLSAYAMVSLGRWHEQQARFHAANFLGALCMLVSLFGQWNLAVCMLEVCWGAIALYGLIRAKNP